MDQLQQRTIVSAMYPVRIDGDFSVTLKVWFAELNDPVEFWASPLDCTRHGKELWIRAMAGEYGPVQIVSAEYLQKSGIRSVEMLTKTLMLERHGSDS